VRSKVVLMGSYLAVAFLICKSATAALPGDKRTILTSGEKVYPIQYQLGQSTVLYFGASPETVICGNKNYFNIEKIKNGITIQPLANFSTNLTVLAQGRRYLFYLMPTGLAKPDGFVEVKWIPSAQARPLTDTAGSALESIREINRRIKVAVKLEMALLREKSLKNGKRRIFEFELKNLDGDAVSTNALEIVASIGRVPFRQQLLVWESDQVEGKQSIRGRLIVSHGGSKAISLTIRFQGKSTRVVVRGERN